jgi:hypothetical protein
MAPPQSITVINPLPWLRSTATRLALSELVSGGQLAANEDGRPAAWIKPPARDREPNPSFDYVVSFICFHERGFTVPASHSCAGYATTTAWSCTTSRRTPSRRRPRSSASMRDSWGSQ